MLVHLSIFMAVLSQHFRVTSLQVSTAGSDDLIATATLHNPFFFDLKLASANIRVLSEPRLEMPVTESSVVQSKEDTAVHTRVWSEVMLDDDVMSVVRQVAATPMNEVCLDAWVQLPILGGLFSISHKSIQTVPFTVVEDPVAEMSKLFKQVTCEVTAMVVAHDLPKRQTIEVSVLITNKGRRAIDISKMTIELLTTMEPLLGTSLAIARTDLQLLGAQLSMHNFEFVPTMPYLASTVIDKMKEKCASSDNAIFPVEVVIYIGSGPSPKLLKKRFFITIPCGIIPQTKEETD